MYSFPHITYNVPTSIIYALHIILWCALFGILPCLKWPQ